MALKNRFRAQLWLLDGKGKRVEQLPVSQEFWDAFSGGKYTQKETKYTPFDGIQRTYVALKEVENVTMESDYKPDVHGPLLKKMKGEGKEDLRGREVEAVVFDIDSDGNHQQNREPYLGVILEVMPPAGDSNDAGTVEKLGLIVSVGTPA